MVYKRSIPKWQQVDSERNQINPYTFFFFGGDLWINVGFVDVLLMVHYVMLMLNAAYHGLAHIKTVCFQWYLGGSRYVIRDEGNQLLVSLS